MIPRRGALGLSLPLLGFFALALIYPVAHVLKRAFVVDGAPSLAAFGLAFRNDVFTASLLHSFGVAFAITALATLFALPLAVLFVNHDFRFKGALQAVLLSAMVLPPFVSAIGFRQLFARCGAVNLLLLKLGWIAEPIDFLGAHPLIGVAVLGALHLYPILFLNLSASLANLDPALFEAAESAGASRLRRFFSIALPLLLPGYFSGAIVVFIFALTDLGAPVVFDAHELIPMQIFERALEGNDDPVGCALVVVLLAATTLLFLASRRLLGAERGMQASKGVGGRGGGGRRSARALPSRARVPVAIGLVLLAAVTLLPHLAIALVAFSREWFFEILPRGLTLEHFARVLEDDVAYLGVRNSLVYATCSTALDLAIGLAIAWLVARRASPLATLLDALAMLPLALPGVVLAFGYVGGFSGDFFAGTPFDPKGSPFLLLVLGYALRRLPYVVRAADAGFRQVPIALEDAGTSLGGSAWRVLRKITLPLLLGNLLAGGILAFSFALLEVSESLILAPSKETYPIAKAIYLLLGDLGSGPQIASAMGLLGAGLLLYALWAASRTLGRGLGELFRA